MSQLYEKMVKANKHYSKKEYKQAFTVYLNLAEWGDIDSQVFVGWMYFNGIGVKVSLENSAYWFERSALLGSAIGTFYFGRLLTTQGKDKEAFAWYQRAADMGSVPAIFRIGYSYMRGKGVLININDGYKYLYTAMKQGHIFAYREIAVQDIRGNRGVARKIIGYFVFFYVIVKGIFFTYIDSNSEMLKG